MDPSFDYIKKLASKNRKVVPVSHGVIYKKTMDFIGAYEELFDCENRKLADDLVPVYYNTLWGVAANFFYQHLSYTTSPDIGNRFFSLLNRMSMMHRRFSWKEIMVSVSINNKKKRVDHEFFNWFDVWVSKTNHVSIADMIEACSLSKKMGFVYNVFNTFGIEQKMPESSDPLDMNYFVEEKDGDPSLHIIRTKIDLSTSVYDIGKDQKAALAYFVDDVAKYIKENCKGIEFFRGTKGIVVRA